MLQEYFGMKLDYSEKKKLKIDMNKYVKGMLDAVPIKFKKGETAEHHQVKICLVKSQAMIRN